MNKESDISLCIRARYRDLRPSERKAADFIMKNINDAYTMTLEQMAKKSMVSQPTIVRMVNALNYSSFKKFRNALMIEHAKKNAEVDEMYPMYGYRIRKTDSVRDVPERIANTTLKMIKSTLTSISTKDFYKMIKIVTEAKKIGIYAVENSVAPASDLTTKLIYLGFHVNYCNDNYLQRIGSSYLTEQDVAIGISYSGNSKDTVDAMREAKKRRAKTIVITNFMDSEIIQYADLILCTSQEQLLYGNTIFSRTSQMMIVDMIYTGIITSDYDKYAKRLDKVSRLIQDKAY